MYLARRRPGLDPDRFIRRWRAHGALAMSMDYWADVDRYAQCSVLGEADASGAVRRADVDGLGELWFARSQHTYASDSAARAAMARDELDTFAEPVATARVVVREIVRLPRPEAVGAKLVRLVRWTGAPAGVNVVDRWQASARRLDRDGTGVARHVLNLVGRQPGSGSLRVDADRGDRIHGHQRRARFRYEREDPTRLGDEYGRYGTARVLLCDNVVLYLAGRSRQVILDL